MKALKIVVTVALMGVLFGAVSTFAQPDCDPYTIPKSDSTFAPEVHHHLLNYQGKLVDYQGKLVHDTLAITFSIYEDSTGGLPLWWETQPAVIIWGGVYSILLGSVTPMPDTLFKNFPVVNWFDRWLGITIGSQSEMKPRQRIAIVGHSTNADMLDGFHYSAVMEEVKRLIEAMDWGRPQRTCSLYEGNCLPDCDTFRPLIDIYVNEVGPDTMEFDGSTPTFQVFNDGSGDAVYGESYDGCGGHFTSTNHYGLCASGSGGGTNDGAAYFDGDVHVTGNVGIGTEASANFLVRATDGTNDRFTVSNSGRVYIKSSVTGDDNNSGSYGLQLDSPDQGMLIRLDGNHPDASHNYITFGGKVGSNWYPMGRIEGQNWSDVLSDPWYLLHLELFGIDMGLAVADEVAAATSTTFCGGLGACETVPIPSLIAAAAANIALVGTKEGVFQTFLWKNLGVAFSSGAGDYAEYLERLNPEEVIEAGDIVGVFGGKITKSIQGAHQILCVSTAPIVLGNMPEEDKEHLYEKVSFLGQVPVKVNGAVKEGDYIIPSGFDDGTGIAVSPELMTADEFSKVVGRAWSCSNNQSLKCVNMAIGLNSGDVAAIVKKQQNENQEIRAQLEYLRSQVAELKVLDQKVAKLEAALEKVSPPGPAEQAASATEMVQGNTKGDMK
ncbi:MAG: hypothetical protein JSV84_00520 [Gemmatimonadota bacterium]|nr:MAG: hypothetical protein JSV84_00520 [Gemmatimonadota bacterium]